MSATQRREPLSSAAQRGRGGRAVILAGGKGTRLAPYTSILPKPLMPIGDKAILEIVLDQLASRQLTDVTLCVGYLAHLIRSVLDDRIRGRIQISYVHETTALGTAGPLRAVDNLDETFIVMNGDVLTTLDYQKFLEAHRRTGNALTVATAKRTTKIDYGVMHLDGSLDLGVRRVTAYEEKPESVAMVSMGIYALEPYVLDYIPEDSYFDFPDLVKALLAAGEPVGSYAFDGPWFDIGRQEDYAMAVEAWTELNAKAAHAPAGYARRPARRRVRAAGALSHS